jgi:hypothetical protein
MVACNIVDCDETLHLCFKLDLPNQMIAICKATRSYIGDVMLYLK